MNRRAQGKSGGHFIWRLIASAAVIPETPAALSGIVTNAGACCDPGWPRAASGMTGAELFKRIRHDSQSGRSLAEG